MSFAYIKKWYGIDLARGERVQSIVSGLQGEVTASNGPLVRVLFDGARTNVNASPKDLKKIEVKREH